MLSNGENFSVGQRQLLCLCRAMVRRTRICVMDEVRAGLSVARIRPPTGTCAGDQATASLDFATDQLVRKCVREAFTDCTIITVAHRLDTILDSDRVMVFEQGRLVEFASPAQLLARPGSFLTGLVEAGKKSASTLAATPRG